MSIIQAQNLTRRFGSVTAVDHLNLEIAEGEIFGLVGPDGAGKTTTMRLLCGLMDPTEGQAIVAGHDVSRELDAVKDQIGYMAQRFGLYGDLTVDENMNFYADLFGIMGEDRNTLAARGAPARHGARCRGADQLGLVDLAQDEKELRLVVEATAHAVQHSGDRDD